MITIEQLEEKDPWEVPGYRFYLTKNDSFVKYGDVVSGNAAAYVCISTALTTNLPAMVYALSYSAADNWVQVDITGGTAGQTYYVALGVTAVSGRKYIVYGRFKVKNVLGVGVTFS